MGTMMKTGDNPIHKELPLEDLSVMAESVELRNRPVFPC
jgi:hypothetical protein